MESRYSYILDAGHGGIIEGEYVTPGKRSPVWPDGRQYFEGVGNRIIRDKISEKLMKLGITHYYINDTEDDIPNIKRAEHANIIAANSSRKCVFISIHSNAGGGTGFEVFTTKGQTKSDPIADILSEELERKMPQFHQRRDTVSDGDYDKEANFTVLYTTTMPAVLSENLFMDTYDPDCRFLLTDKGLQQIADAHVEAILRIEKEISL